MVSRATVVHTNGSCDSLSSTLRRSTALEKESCRRSHSIAAFSFSSSFKPIGRSPPPPKDRPHMLVPLRERFISEALHAAPDMRRGCFGVRMAPGNRLILGIDYHSSDYGTGCKTLEPSTNEPAPRQRNWDGHVDERAKP